MQRDVQQHKADFFKAIASPTRLAMLEALADRESSVTALASLVGLDVSTASRHLAQLRVTGVVAARREGSALIYRLSDDRVAQLLSVARAIIVSNLEANGEMLADLRESHELA